MSETNEPTAPEAPLDAALPDFSRYRREMLACYASLRDEFGPPVRPMPAEPVEFKRPAVRPVLSEQDVVLSVIAAAHTVVNGPARQEPTPPQGDGTTVHPPGSLPRFWRLFSYILPRSTRERVFEPAYQDLQADYLEVRGKYRTAWSRRWLKLCFGLRTVLMVAGCLRAWAKDATASWLLSFVPAHVRRWFRSP